MSFNQAALYNLSFNQAVLYIAMRQQRGIITELVHTLLSQKDLRNETYRIYVYLNEVALEYVI